MMGYQSALEWLGGAGAFTVMTGGRIMRAGDNLLILKFPRPGAGKPNYCEIEYMPGPDLYKMTFKSVHGINAKTLVEEDGIYGDSVKGFFESTTGLYLSVPKIRRA
jgi:hypothetical protein